MFAFTQSQLQLNNEMDNKKKIENKSIHPLCKIEEKNNLITENVWTVYNF